MALTPKTRIRAFWAGMSLPDLGALAVTIVYVGLWAIRQFYPGAPQSGFLLFLFICSVIYFTGRGWFWIREHLLWSLRNRLITAYIFIAVVPVLLLLTMAGLAAYLMYWQLGSYVVYTDMEERVERLNAFAGAVATSYAVEAAAGKSVAVQALPVDSETYLKNALAALPGLRIEMDTGEDVLARKKGPLPNRFRGLVYRHGELALWAVVNRQSPTGRILLSAIVPVSQDFLDSMSSEFGPIRVSVLRPRKEEPESDIPIIIGRQEFASIEQIAARAPNVPPGANPFDKLITGIVGLDVLDMDGPDGSKLSVIASFSTRPSILNRRLFSPLGNLGGAAATALLIIGGVLLVIELGSLVTGVALTRTITTAVDNLYQATQHVQSGDLSFRVRIPHRDQLADLGNSFNSMMHSVSTLIEEQRQRQRLENELSIAHEVQLQLYPHSLPQLAGVELEAICRPARVVSGDYYDFIRITPTKLAIALADISGKGISAALLMANVQAALRSYVLRYREAPSGPGYTEISTAEILSHLNRHLFRNSSSERYATFFLGVYDAETRQLTYTNAGHLPPVYILNGAVTHLEAGGTVVGLFDNVPFEQGTVRMEPGGILVAYSDGLIEPENVYGEEFGRDRLTEAALRVSSSTANEIAESLIRAIEEWSGTPEQADDMTVIVSRFSAVAPEVRA